MDTTRETLTRSELVIRPAQQDDRPALEAIAAQTWDGDDYLPDVLDDWFDDPHDGFFIAEARGRVLGLAKLTRFAEGEWWLEGLRVDPAYQGQGIARILHHFMMNRLRQMGTGIVRFSTGGGNEAVQALARPTGFEHVASFLPYRAEPLAEPVAMLRPLGPEDAARVGAWLADSARFAAAQRSVEQDWSFYLLTEERLRARLERGLVYGAEQEGVLSAVLVLSADEAALKIAFVDAAADQLEATLRDVRRLAAALVRDRVTWKVPDEADLVAAAERAGFERAWDGTVWLFARDIHLTQHAEVRVEQLPAPPAS